MSTQATTATLPQVFPTAGDAAPRPGWTETFARDLRELYRFRAVLANLVGTDLQARYHRSLLGFFWTLLNPVLMMITYTVVFSHVFKFDKGGADYALYLFSGMLPWTLLFSTVNDCSLCILCQESLIRKIYVPKLVFPISRLALNAVMLVLSMGALFLVMLPLGAPVTWKLLVVPLAMVLLAGFALGLGLIVAIVNTYYRDFGHLIAVFMQAWYFATPILYPISIIPEEYRWRFWLNPAYPFMYIFQSAIYNDPGQPLSWVAVGTAAGIAAVALGIGYATFKSYEDRLVFRL